MQSKGDGANATETYEGVEIYGTVRRGRGARLTLCGANDY